MSLLAGQVHYLSATTPLKSAICDIRFTIWQAASVPPRVSGVLETLPRADAQPFEVGSSERGMRSLRVLCGSFRTPHSAIRNEMVRLPGIAPGHPPWRGDILLLNHSRRKVNGPEALCVRAPGPRHFNKDQTPLGDLLDPNPRFHGGCVGVWRFDFALARFAQG